MNIFFFIIFYLSLIKNGKSFPYTEINISSIISHKYIFIYHPWNKNSQIIYKALKEISPNNLLIIDFIKLFEPYLFLRHLSSYINKNKMKNINLNIPLLIKSVNNNFIIYNNEPNLKDIKKFIERKGDENIDTKIYSKINHKFIKDIFVQQENCLIIFYIKNYKSKKILKKLIPEMKNKLKICIAYTDITNKFSYKLFDILEGYENELPCLRYIKFKNNKLYFTKKEKINLLENNIIYKINNFIENSINNNQVFYHIYNDKENIHNINLNINRKCQKRKYIINLYYNNWCEFCIELFIMIEDIFKENQYILDNFEFKKYLIEKNSLDKINTYDFYFNFLPRLFINDIFRNITYEYLGDYKKEEISNFLINKINLLNFL